MGLVAGTLPPPAVGVWGPAVAMLLSRLERWSRLDRESRLLRSMLNRLCRHTSLVSMLRKRVAMSPMQGRAAGKRGGWARRESEGKARGWWRGCVLRREEQGQEVQGGRGSCGGQETTRPLASSPPPPPTPTSSLPWNSRGPHALSYQPHPSARPQIAKQARPKHRRGGEGGEAPHHWGRGPSSPA